MTDDNDIIPDDDWLRQVKREWNGPEGVKIAEMMTGIVRICIQDTCYTSAPDGLDPDELVLMLQRAGIPLKEAGQEDALPAG